MKQFRSTKVIVRCVEPGKHKTADTPSVPPKIEEKPAGTIFSTSDFSRDEFTELYNDGTLVEVVDNGGDDASALYDSQTGKPPTTASGEAKETEAERKERLLNEAKTLGVEGVTKAMKADTIEAKIAEHKNAREADGSKPSTQEGAGRQNPSEGETGGEGAGGDAEGSADDAALLG